MKICFIGSCGHSRQAYEVLKKRAGAELCGFAYGSENEITDTAKSPFEGVPLFGSYKEMLDTVKPELAVISPIFGYTGRIIIECAERGIDVFAEKPIAATLNELKNVEDAVKTHNIRFCAMHYLRFAPAFYKASQLVRDGAIGKPVMITAQKSYKFGSRPEWYSDPDLYTGTVPWVGIHALDWIYNFTQSPFMQISATSIGSPEMAAVCQFKLENGVFGTVNLDYLRPNTAPTHGDDRIRVAGDSGVIEVIGDTVKLTNGDGAVTLTPSAEETPELLTEFLNGGQPIGIDEIFHITKAAIVARDSAGVDAFGTV